MIKSITVLAGFTGREFYVAITDTGEPLFCLYHVCRDLGITNATNCKRRLRPEGCHLVNLKKFLASPRMGYPIANFVTEDNLNRCLLTSRKAVARDFQEWFNNTVLPLFATPETDTTCHPASTQQAPNKCTGANRPTKPETDFQQAPPETSTTPMDSTPKTDTPMKPNHQADTPGINVFSNPAFGEVRTTIDENGEPLFCAADVCNALGYANSRKAIADHCEVEDVTKRDTLTEGGEQQMTFVNESGLYSLIFGSTLPSAKEFKRWVTSEVLPTLRRTGSYSLQLPTDYAGALRLAADLYEKNQAQKALLAKTEKVLQETAQTLREAKPKADYCDNVLQSVSLISVRQIAKDFGRSAEWLNKYLNTKGIQFRQGRQWILYQKYADMDLARSVTAQGSGRGDDRTFMLTKWTERGRRFITGLLAQDGIFPVPTAQERALVDAQLELIYE